MHPNSSPMEHGPPNCAAYDTPPPGLQNFHRKALRNPIALVPNHLEGIPQHRGWEERCRMTLFRPSSAPSVGDANRRNTAVSSCDAQGGW